MQKTMIAAGLLGLMTASSAGAATLLGVKVGGDYWQADASGDLPNDSGMQQDFDYGSSGQTSLWFAFEHPVPLLPNLLVRDNRLKEQGGATDSFSFAGMQFSGELTSSMDLSNTDFVLYYELLDNDILSLDVGGAYKQMHGIFRVKNDAGDSARKDFDEGIIMGYAGVQLGVPGMGLFGFADLMAGLNESEVYDYSAGLGWEFDGIALDTRIRAGYRQFSFDVSGFDGIASDSGFKGFFAGAELVF